MGSESELPRRLRRCPRHAFRGLDVRSADSFRARLAGLVGLSAIPRGVGLMLPRTRSVHTLGMRFALDLVWLDHSGAIVRIDESVPPLRLRSCRRAVAVLELRAGEARRAGLLGADAQ